jgi:hypothetical protein
MLRPLDRLSLLGLIFLLGGCATVVAVELPTQRMVTPEAQGSLLAGNAYFGYGSNARVVLADALGDAEPNVDSPHAENANNAHLGVDLGLLERLDVTASTHRGLGAKLQLLGEPRAKASAGNYSLAVTGSVGRTSARQTGDFEYDVTGKRIQVETEALATYYDGAVIAGRRLGEDHLLYLSLGVTPFSAEGSFTRDIDGEETESWTVDESDGHVRNALLGYAYDPEHFLLQAEGGVARVELKGMRPKTLPVVSLTIGVHW